MASQVWKRKITKARAVRYLGYFQWGITRGVCTDAQARVFAVYFEERMNQGSSGNSISDFYMACSSKWAIANPKTKNFPNYFRSFTDHLEFLAEEIALEANVSPELPVLILADVLEEVGWESTLVADKIEKSFWGSNFRYEPRISTATVLRAMRS